MYQKFIRLKEEKDFVAQSVSERPTGHRFGVLYKGWRPASAILFPYVNSLFDSNTGFLVASENLRILAINISIQENRFWNILKYDLYL